MSARSRTRAHARTCSQAQTKRIEGVVEAAESSQRQPPQGQAPSESTERTEPDIDSDAAINRLKQASGRGDLSKLVAYFCSLESLNFHLFDACNVTNMRISGLKKELQDIQVRVSKSGKDSRSASCAVAARVHAEVH